MTCSRGTRPMRAEVEGVALATRRGLGDDALEITWSSWGRTRPSRARSVAEYLSGWRVRGRAWIAAPRSTSRLAGLTGATLETAPSVCRSCVWWQSRGNREPEKAKWIERAEEEWGAWGTIYRDDDGARDRVDAVRAVRALPAARPTFRPGRRPEDAVLVTCAYLLSDTQPWVEQSLFLAAIGEARDKGARALEAFAYRYRESHARARAVPRPPDGVPARLPRRLRLPDDSRVGPDRARAARARRARHRSRRARARRSCGRSRRRCSRRRPRRRPRSD